MFYCDPCKKENNWPESIMKSNGKCEMCDKNAICNDVHHSRLTVPDKEKSGIRKAQPGS